MYKVATVGLLGLMIILVIPAGTQSITNDGFKLSFLIDNVFAGLSDVDDNSDINSIYSNTVTDKTTTNTTLNTSHDVKDNAGISAEKTCGIDCKKNQEYQVIMNLLQD